MRLKDTCSSRRKPFTIAQIIFAAFTLVGYFSPSQAQADQASEDILKTLIAGLKSREAILGAKAISGVAIEKRFISNSE